LTIPAAGAFTSVKGPVSLSFKTDKNLLQGDKIILKLPGWGMDATTTTTTTESCETTTFAVSVANTGENDAKITFTAAGAAMPANNLGTACTITTDASQLTTAAAAQGANLNTRTMEIAGGTDSYTATAIATSTATVVPAFSASDLTFDAPMKTATPLTLKFTCAAPMQVAQTLKVVLPQWTLTGTAPPTTQDCGTTTFTTAVANSGDADATITFTVATADLTGNTACTMTTATATATTPAVVQAANLNTRTLVRMAEAADAIEASTALTGPLYDDSLHIAYPVVGTATALTYTFKSAVAIAQGDTIKLTLPSWTVAVGTPTTSGCGTTTLIAVAADKVTNSGETTAALEFTTATATLTADTACTITIPSSMAKCAAAAQAQNLDTRTALPTIAATAGVAVRKISTSTATVTAAALTNTKLDVATTTGSTATSLSLEFDSNIPLAVGDYVTMTLPNWGVTGTAAPTTSGCGTTTFTTTTRMSGTAHAVVNFIVATATLDVNKHTTHNCTLTWATGATTPSTAQAANLATRTLSATIAAGANIANTTIATSTATTAAPAPAPAGNGTGTGGTTTGTFSTATTTITFSGYTYAAGAAATTFGNVVGCAYAKTVSDATTSLDSDLCTASPGPTFTYLTGSSTTNTVSAARRTGSNVAVALKVYHSLLSQTAAEAAVTQVGTTVATINAAVAAINAAAGTNFSTAQLTASTMTAATWTHSSASVVVPSITAMFSALLLVLMQ